MAINTATRFIGECQCCGNQQKLDSAQTLVLHGYKRPGWGYTVGKCPGTGFKPYELSCDQIPGYIANLEDNITRATLALNTYLPEDVETTAKALKAEYKRLGKPEGTYIFQPDEQFRAAQKAAADARHALVEARSFIAWAKLDIPRLQKKIETWTLKPLKTVVEVLQAKQKETADRKAARLAAKLAKRDEKRAKEAARKAKEDEKDAKIQAEVDAVAARIRAAAGNRDEILTIVLPYLKKKTRGWNLFRLQCNDVFEAVGLFDPKHIVEDPYTGWPTSFLFHKYVQY